MSEVFQVHPIAGRQFEDTIDGYFPLHISLSQMLVRNGFAAAVVDLTHLPVMDIPDLPFTAPVPLNIASGRAGLVDRMRAFVSQTDIRGQAHWRWLNADHTTGDLDPMVRLAEPAYLTGIGLQAGDIATTCFGALAPATGDTTLAWLKTTTPNAHMQAANTLGWPCASVFATGFATNGLKQPAPNGSPPTDEYLLLRV